MIKKIKHIISLCAITSLLALTFIGCSQATIPESKSAEEIKLDNVKSSLTVPEKIWKSITEIELLSEKDGVKIEWESSDSNVINTSTKAVVHSNEDKVVTLKAKLSIKTYKAEKTFSVTVVGKNTPPTDEEVLTELLSGNELKFTPSFNNKTIQVTETLPSILKKESRDIQLTWEEVEKNLNVKFDSTKTKVTISQALYDYVAKLKVTAKLGDVTKSKVIEVNIPKLTEYVNEYKEFSNIITQTITFTPNTITDEVIKTKNDKKEIISKEKYTYTIDPKTNILKIKQTHITENGNVAKIDDFIKKESNSYIDKIVPKFEQLEKNPTRENLKAFFMVETDNNEEISETIVISTIGQNLDTPITGSSLTPDQINQINNQPVKTQDAAIKKFITNLKQEIVIFTGLETTDTWEKLCTADLRKNKENEYGWLNGLVKYEVKDKKLSFNIILDPKVPYINQINGNAIFGLDNNDCLMASNRLKMRWSYTSGGEFIVANIKYDVNQNNWKVTIGEPSLVNKVVNIKDNHEKPSIIITCGNITKELLFKAKSVIMRSASGIR